MSKKPIFIAAITVVVVAGGGYLAFSLVAGGGPAPASLTSSSPSGATGAPHSLEGSWKVSASDSFVGYRVREKLAMLPAPSDAVGRTGAVTGTMQIAGLTVTSVDVSADLSQLQSDRQMRDRSITHRGLETSTYPKATFTLSTPITFSTRPASGEIIRESARGKLTLHGQTKDVTVPLQARWTSGRIEVTGSTPIVFADYVMQPIQTFQVTTQDHGTMEFRLVFVPA